ncbi:hypothetical protein BVI434_450006 [Burkholderia vietnamiensis]|nr:hypothetical protein BVI434_450006 [Burkholderia vietnamiensis]
MAIQKTGVAVGNRLGQTKSAAVPPPTVQATKIIDQTSSDGGCGYDSMRGGRASTSIAIDV